MICQLHALPFASVAALPSVPLNLFAYPAVVSPVVVRIPPVVASAPAPTPAPAAKPKRKKNPLPPQLELFRWEHKDRLQIVAETDPADANRNHIGHSTNTGNESEGNKIVWTLNALKSDQLCQLAMNSAITGDGFNLALARKSNMGVGHNQKNIAKPYKTAQKKRITTL